MGKYDNLGFLFILVEVDVVASYYIATEAVLVFLLS